jgi:hypothetical protein
VLIKTCDVYNVVGIRIFRHYFLLKFEVDYVIIDIVHNSIH